MTTQETLDAAARGEGRLGRSQHDEPVFVLVARDKFSSAAIRYWASLVEAASLPDLPSRDKAAGRRAQGSRRDGRLAHGARWRQGAGLA